MDDAGFRECLIDALLKENERFSILLNECFGVLDELGIETKLRDAIIKALNDADDRETAAAEGTEKLAKGEGT